MGESTGSVRRSASLLDELLLALAIANWIIAPLVAAVITLG